MLPISLDQRPGLRQFKSCFQELDILRGANVKVKVEDAYQSTVGSAQALMNSLSLWPRLDRANVLPGDHNVVEPDFSYLVIRGLGDVEQHPGRSILLATLFSIPCHWLFVLSLRTRPTSGRCPPPGIDCGNRGEDNKDGTGFGSLPPNGLPPVAPWSLLCACSMVVSQRESSRAHAR